MTGLQFNENLDIVNDTAYGLYFDPAKRDHWIINSIIKLVSTEYASLDGQARYDELFKLISTQNLFLPTNNTITIQAGGAIADYFHLLGIKPTFEVLYESLTVSGAMNTTPVKVTFNMKTTFRSKEKALFSGVTGPMAVINGYRYLKQLNDYVYALYLDAALTIPIVGYGTFSGTVTVKKVYDKNYATQFKSGLKGGGFHYPELYKPMFEIADGLIKIYPMDSLCTIAEVDYMKKPTVLPNLTDNVIDLELTYSARFLQRWIDETVKLFAENTREYPQVQVQQQEASKP